MFYVTLDFTQIRHLDRISFPPHLNDRMSLCFCGIELKYFVCEHLFEKDMKKGVLNDNCHAESQENTVLENTFKKTNGKPDKGLTINLECCKCESRKRGLFLFRMYFFSCCTVRYKVAFYRSLFLKLYINRHLLNQRQQLQQVKTVLPDHKFIQKENKIWCQIE